MAFSDDDSKRGTNQQSTRAVALSRSELPRLVGPDDLIPRTGWAVMAFSKVYNNAQPVGIFVNLTILRDATAILAYEHIRDPPR